MELNKVDFEPALIGEVAMQEGKAVIDFPSQCYYDHAEYGDVMCHCQIHIEDGQWISNEISSATKIDEFEVKAKLESRYCFLPEGYFVDGAVTYTAKFKGSTVLQISGRNLKLHILNINEKT